MNKYIDLLRLKIKGYIIIDDFFSDGICNFLWEYALTREQYNHQYPDYKSVEFDFDNSNISLKEVADKYVTPKISLSNNYYRAWSFVYDNFAVGTLPHAEPYPFSVNIWVTPDECVEDHNKNGLKIYRKKVPKGVPWQVYNNSKDQWTVDFLKESKYDIIPYKFNRAVIFTGNTFHSTDNVHMKPGDHNKRVNYTFLYN